MGKVQIPGGAYEGALGASFIYDVNERFIHEAFKTRPTFHDQDGDGSPTGATGDENIIKTDRNTFEYHILGAGQTILFPSWDTNGLDVALDLVADEGCEVCPGITARSRAAYTVGTDEFYAKCQFSIADVSGTDDCAFGFRKMEAYQANVDDYDEAAYLNVISGDVYIETILNGGGTASTDTGEDWGDGEDYTLEVRVEKAGAVTFLIDGVVVSPAGWSQFSFDSGEVVVPFFYFLHDATSPGAIYLKLWQCGLWGARGLESAVDSRH